MNLNTVNAASVVRVIGESIAYLCCFQNSLQIACRLPHCRFEDDICKTVKAPLARKGRPSSKHSVDNLATLLKAADRRQLNPMQLGSNAAQWKSQMKATLPPRVATSKPQAMIMQRRGKMLSRKLV